MTCLKSVITEPALVNSLRPAQALAMRRGVEKEPAARDTAGNLVTEIYFVGASSSTEMPIPLATASP